MMYNVAQFVTRALIFLTIIVLASARPQHFGDQNQDLANDAGNAAVGMPPAMSDAQMDMLARLLAAQYKEQLPLRGDPRWESLKALDVKRQRNFRHCYFNPVSCFKK